jgi:hypothetical protein
MRSEYFLILGSLLVAPMAAATEDAGRLTLTEAKAVVSRALLDNGQRMARVDHADYAGNGNVVVDVVTTQGIPLRHVLVDGKTHQIAAPKSRG